VRIAARVVVVVAMIPFAWFAFFLGFWLITGIRAQLTIECAGLGQPSLARRVPFDGAPGRSGRSGEGIE